MATRWSIEATLAWLKCERSSAASPGFATREKSSCERCANWHLRIWPTARHNRQSHCWRRRPSRTQLHLLAERQPAHDAEQNGANEKRDVHQVTGLAEGRERRGGDQVE